MGVVEKAIPVGSQIINNLEVVASGKLEYVVADTIIPIPDSGYKQQIVVVFSYDGVGKREEFEFNGVDMKYIGSFLCNTDGSYINIVLCTGSGELTMK